MIGILDVLMPIEAAQMPGHEPVLMVYADPVWVSFDGEALVCELGRHRVTVGIEGDAELARGAQRHHPRQIIGIRVGAA